MKRTYNEIMSYISTAALLLAFAWAVCSHYSLLSIAVTVETVIITLYFAVMALQETFKKIRKDKEENV